MAVDARNARLGVFRSVCAGGLTEPRPHLPKLYIGFSCRGRAYARSVLRFRFGTFYTGLLSLEPGSAEPRAPIKQGVRRKVSRLYEK